MPWSNLLLLSYWIALVSFSPCLSSPVWFLGAPSVLTIQTGALRDHVHFLLISHMKPHFSSLSPSTIANKQTSAIIKSRRKHRQKPRDASSTKDGLLSLEQCLYGPVCPESEQVWMEAGRTWMEAGRNSLAFASEGTTWPRLLSLHL